MGDPSHLEKMGRELKCPICLSLLNSAVSLPCNHVFCNACIMKSMKSGYNCPVCKVPYRRREIRAAPHMDNLVSVYKSMEVASGVNIFITQTAPANKPSNDKKRVEGDPISGKIIDQSCQVMENQQMSKKKGFSRTDKSIEEFPGPIIVKPTFPTKKRVQVPQSRPAELHCELVGDAKEESKNTSSLSMNPAPNGNKELVLSPFFWLRDEEDEEGEEKSSQLADGDRLLDTTPPNIPSFSDMKDSDDESPSKAEVNEKSNSMDLFDCEMFEWTQRACSPELLPSPVKVQALHTSETVQESELKESSQGATEEVAGTRSMECMNVTHKTGTLNEDPSVSTPGDKTINQIRGGKSNKRGRKAKQIAGQKRANSNGDKVCKVHVDLKKDSENFISMQATDEIGNSLNLKKARKMDKWVGFGTDVAEPNASTSLGAESLDDGEQNVVNELPTVLCEEQGVDKDPDLKTSEENIKMKTHSQKDCSLRVKRRKLDSAKTVILEEVSKVQSRRNKSRVHEESFSSVSLGDDKNISDLKETPSKQTRKVKSTLTSKCNRALGLKKKMMVSFNDVSKDGFIDIYQEGYTNVSVKEIQSVELVQGDAAVKVLDGSIVEKLPLTSGVALRKCDTVTNRVQCAFCLSSAESQVAGEMLHYFNGRPVSADYDGGSKIIHSHRNCTEWAPNIYFENDAAINLEAELIRSRRIKCCCCGLKGAALGCYEKSCRKSFHVTCAKLTPECRWDTDNFVMLCPIHASSKLPNEDTGSRQMSKKRTSKGNMGTECNQVAVKHDTSSHENRKFCGSSGKLVLCCSALTVEEREIVSEFGKLSRVTVSKKWVSSVTHVIASTDENGACRRTLKVLMGILEGKWIVNIEWVKACISTMKQVDEEQYEITLDVHGIRDGPRLGRERLLNKRPKLFEGCKFYIMGDFVPSYKGYLQDLVIAAGGTVLHRRSLSGDQGVMLSSSSAASPCIIYSLEMPDKCDPRKKDLILSQRRSDAEALASSTGAKAVSNSWILNSIAACKLQSLSEK